MGVVSCIRRECCVFSSERGNILDVITSQASLLVQTTLRLLPSPCSCFRLVLLAITVHCTRVSYSSHMFVLHEYMSVHLICLLCLFLYMYLLSVYVCFYICLFLYMYLLNVSCVHYTSRLYAHVCV